MLRSRVLERAQNSGRMDDEDVERRLASYTHGNQVEFQLERNAGKDGRFERMASDYPIMLSITDQCRLTLRSQRMMCSRQLKRVARNS